MCVHAPCPYVQENSRRQKTLVCEKFDQLYSILEEKKREMSQKVTDEQEEKVNYIRSLSRKYGDHLEESCKIVEMGIQTMEEPEMALFLQVRVNTRMSVWIKWFQLLVLENPTQIKFRFLTLVTWRGCFFIYSGTLPTSCDNLQGSGLSFYR